jgi:hypothetical protein
VRPFFIVALPIVALGLAACEGCRSGGGAGVAAPSASSEAGPPTARLYLLSDLAGALEPCGCTKDQLGGFDHFGSWIQAERTHAPASVVAAAGPLFFMDEELDRERAEQDRSKAQTIANVLRSLDLAAFAPGTNDWSDGAEALAKLGAAAGATVIVGNATRPPPFGQVVVRQVGDLKVGFLGFGQDPTAGGNAEIEATVARGAEAAKQQGANVLVALTAVGRGEAKRIADAVPDLSVVVVGSPKARGEGNTSAPQGEQVGNVLVVQAANHLQSVGVLDLYVREPLAPGHIVRLADGTGLERSAKREELARRIDDLHVKIASWERDPSTQPGDLQARKRELATLEHELAAFDVKPPPAHGSFFRFTLKEVRESLGRDPATVQQMLGYYKAVDEHNRVAFADRLPPPQKPDAPIYVGMDVCTDCHAPARAVWQGTAHARAYATLASQYKEFNLDCVGCHVTGYERPGGSTVTHVEKLKDVQCEVCHGPGSQHVISPLDTSSLVVKPQPGVCLECHHPPHVEQFDPVAKMKEILGPGHGMPLVKRD